MLRRIWPLDPGDVVTIFSQADIRVPQAQRTKFVRLEGEFKQAGIYSVLPSETLPQLVARAGGSHSAAYLFGSNLPASRRGILQQLRLNDYLQNLELEIDRATIAASASIGTCGPSCDSRFQEPGGQIPYHPCHRSRWCWIFRKMHRDRQSAQHATGGWRSLRGSLQAQHGECGWRCIRPKLFLVPENAQSVGGYLRLAGGPTKERRWQGFVHHSRRWLGDEPEVLAEWCFRKHV